MSAPSNQRKGVGFALLAAGLFGLSAPLAGSVSPHVEPVLFVGLLYLGSGIGLAGYSLLSRARRQSGSREAALQRADAPWLGEVALAALLFASGAA